MIISFDFSCTKECIFHLEVYQHRILVANMTTLCLCSKASFAYRMGLSKVDLASQSCEDPFSSGLKFSVEEDSF